MAAKPGRQIIPDLERRGRLQYSAKDSALSPIAHEQARAGDIEEALKTAESITTVTDGVRATATRSGSAKWPATHERNLFGLEETYVVRVEQEGLGFLYVAPTGLQHLRVMDTGTGDLCFPQCEAPGRRADWTGGSARRLTARSA